MNPSPGLRGGLSRLTARVIGSRFAKPIARVAMVVAGVVVLAVIGNAASPRTFGPSASAATSASAPPEPRLASPAVPSAASPPAPAIAPVGPSPSRGAASPDDPVVLNTATGEELRRLPGIGEKRATAILALRARVGRFRAVEDLLKVKGVGRATLKRLRPLIRLEPRPAPPDAGVQIDAP